LSVAYRFLGGVSEVLTLKTPRESSARDFAASDRERELMRHKNKEEGKIALSSLQYLSS
jgi:hypothetical protein